VATANSVDSQQLRVQSSSNLNQVTARNVALAIPNTNAAPQAYFRLSNDTQSLDANLQTLSHVTALVLGNAAQLTHSVSNAVFNVESNQYEQGGVQSA
jgi:hypothetical protein